MAKSLESRIEALEKALSPSDDATCIIHDSGPDAELLGFDCRGQYFPRAADESEDQCLERVERSATPVNGFIHLITRRAPAEKR